MTPEQFRARMREIYGEWVDDHDSEEPYAFDREEAHRKADSLMAEALAELGYEEGIKIFDNAPKWYA